MREISRETGAFVLAMDHFGKAVETGTRGTIAKEDNADAVLVTLGEKSISGTVDNPRVGIRKCRGGIAGREYPFATQVRETGRIDPQGRARTTLAIEWTAGTLTSECPPVRTWPKSLKLFHEVLVGALLDGGIDMRPWDDGPPVKAVDCERLRPDFYERCIADGDSELATQDTRKKALQRAAKAARDAGLVGTRQINEVQYIWLAATGEQPCTGRHSTQDNGTRDMSRDVPLCPGTGRDMGL